MREYSFENNDTEEATPDIFPKPWKTDDSLRCIKLIGEGSYSKVYKALDQADVVNPNVAVKCVDIRGMLRTCIESDTTREAGVLATLLNEIVVLSVLSSEYVVRYISCWAEAEDSSQHKLDRDNLQEYVEILLSRSAETSTSILWAPRSNIYIKMELCQYTLKYFLENCRLIPDFGNGHIAPIFRDVTMCLKHIHAKGFIHRDIKPGNIFCKMNKTGGCTWVIGDFGLATKYFGDRRFGNVGTKDYWSPELRSGSGYTTKTDMYSLGLLFLELLQRKCLDTNMSKISAQLGKLSNSKQRFLYLKVLVEDKFVIWVKLINKLVNPGDTNRICCKELEIALSRIRY